MIKNAKKTDAEKHLIKFRNQLHTLLIRNPEIRLGVDSFGDILAFIPEGDRPRVHLPTCGKQELISKYQDAAAVEEKKRKQEANDQIAMSMGYL